MDTLPLVTVIMPIRNEANYIARSLGAVLAQDYPRERLEILVVDGISNEGTRDIIQKIAWEDARVNLLDNPRKIVPRALNIGIEKAKGEIIMRMDAHNVYPPNYISELVSWLEKSGADNVGGICITKSANQTPVAKAIALALAHPFGVGNAYFRIGSAEPRWVDTVPFGCYRREIFDRIGMFDEELVRNQDDEFNLRLKKHGGKILLVPDIVSHYYARDSLTKLWRMYWQYGYFKPLVAKKIGGILTLRQLIPAFFISSLLITGTAGIWFSPAWKIFAIIIGSYLAADLFCSIKAAYSHGTKRKLWLIFVFPVIHFSYGFGYLKGILDFWILKQKGKKTGIKIPLSR